MLFWLLLWEGLAFLVDKEVLLPPASSVLLRMWEFFGDKSYYLAVGASLFRILLGFLAGILCGILFALLSFAWRPMDDLLAPLFTAIRATPVASFIILALVWLGRSIVPSFTAFLMVLPIVYGSVLRGFRSADPLLLEVTKVYNMGFGKRFRHLYIPSASPYFLNAVKTSLGLAWKAGVAAEVLCTLRDSIGGNIYDSKVYLESVDLLAWTLTVILLSLLLEYGLSALITRWGNQHIVREVAYDAGSD